MKPGDRIRVTGEVRVWGMSITGRVGKIEAVSLAGVTVRLSHPPDPRVAVVCVQPEDLTVVTLDAVFVCVRGRRPSRPRKCSGCGFMTGTKLCDGRVPSASGRGRTRLCSVPLCPSCAVHVEPDTDYCPRCNQAREKTAAAAALPPVQPELFK